MLQLFNNIETVMPTVNLRFSRIITENHRQSWKIKKKMRTEITVKAGKQVHYLDTNV